jgi:cation:H+ antiporter
MPALIVQFVALAAVVAVAGTFLARSADQIAEATGLSRLLVGSVLLAAATSLPELTVNITAIRSGQPDLAVGDLFGACLMNLLVLAVLDLMYHSAGSMLSRQSASHALSSTLGIALAAIATVGIITAGKLPRGEFLGMETTTWCLLASYVLGARMVFMNQRISARAAAEARPRTAMENTPGLMWRPGATFGFAALALFVAGPRLADVAASIASESGLGATFVGTTLLAICTTLPELVISVTAVRLKAFDLAIGNVFGSNAFNMLLLVPLDLAHPGPLLADVVPLHAVTALGVILATAVAVLGQLYQVEKRIHLIEPDALLVLVTVIVFQIMVFRLSSQMGTAPS